jgi:hypothetical protein
MATDGPFYHVWLKVIMEWQSKSTDNWAYPKCSPGEIRTRKTLRIRGKLLPEEEIEPTPESPRNGF